MLQLFAVTVAHLHVLCRYCMFTLTLTKTPVKMVLLLPKKNHLPVPLIFRGKLAVSFRAETSPCKTFSPKISPQTKNQPKFCWFTGRKGIFTIDPIKIKYSYISGKYIYLFVPMDLTKGNNISRTDEVVWGWNLTRWMRHEGMTSCIFSYIKRPRCWFYPTSSWRNMHVRSKWGNQSFPSWSN